MAARISIGDSMAAWRSLFVALWLGVASSALAQATVATLGGGPTDANPTSYSGNADGDTLQEAQFNAPGGLALDLPGNVLYAADTLNGSVRRLNLVDGRTTSFLTGLATPVDVDVDADTNLFVLTSGDGLIRRYDLFGNFSGTVNSTSFAGATALVLDANGDLYVAESGGAIKKVTSATGVVTTLPVAAGTIGSASGIETLESGKLAVSDATKHVVWQVDPVTGAATVIAGILGTAGGNDGVLGVGTLNGPLHLAQGGGDILVVADSGTHAVRAIGADGTISRLYGVPVSSWVSELPGWEDGSATFAESRSPAGVVVDGAGAAYVSEQYYHLIRRASGTGLSGPGGSGGGGSGGSATVSPPSLSFTPNTGYFPMGRTVTVQSSSTNVFYTTDGSEPTTNSLPVAMTNGVGAIKWKNSTNGLTGLRVAAFVTSGTNSVSTNVTGVTATTNSIGVPAGLGENLAGGVGATVVVPVVVNLRPGDQLKTLGFRLEVTALGNAPVIDNTFTAVSVTTNDFIPLVTSDGDASGPAQFTVTPPYFGGPFQKTRGLSINFYSTNGNLSVSGHAVVAMVAIPISKTAAVGHEYSIDVVLPSGTADTAGRDVIIEAAPARKLVVTNISYLVGDTAPAGWYNAGDFGNTPEVDASGSTLGAGQLLFSDVNNAFNAAVGIRPPYPFTDVFDAMDVYPEDTAGTVGGDGQIRFLDWQIILLRQQHLNTNANFGVSATNWSRAWNSSGVRAPGVTNLNPSRVPTSLTPAEGYPGRVWERQVLMVSGGAENALPGGAVSVPVHARVSAAARLRGLQFRAVIRAENGAPQLTAPVEFVSALSGERRVNGAPGEIAVAWDIGQLDLAPASSNWLGDIRFVIPGSAGNGQCYRIEIESADGSPDFTTQYEFETRTGCIWIGGSAPTPPSLVSDQWRQTFFAGGSLAADTDDADGDGFGNLLEYLAGTNPTNAQSLLRLDLPVGAGSPLELISAPGKRYVLECRDQLAPDGWLPVSTNVGTGQIIEFPMPDNSQGTRFYRLRIDP